MTTDKPDRVVVACNLTGARPSHAEGAKAYVTVVTDPGSGHDRMVLLIRSRGGRMIEKRVGLKELTNFRIKRLPAEHPLYYDERIMNFSDPWSSRDTADAFIRDLERTKEIL